MSLGFRAFVLTWGFRASGLASVGDKGMRTFRLGPDGFSALCTA